MSFFGPRPTQFQLADGTWISAWAGHHGDKCRLWCDSRIGPVDYRVTAEGHPGEWKPMTKLHQRADGKLVRSSRGKFGAVENLPSGCYRVEFRIQAQEFSLALRVSPQIRKFFIRRTDGGWLLPDTSRSEVLCPLTVPFQRVDSFDTHCIEIGDGEISFFYVGREIQVEVAKGSLTDEHILQMMREVCENINKETGQSVQAFEQ